MSRYNGICQAQKPNICRCICCNCDRLSLYAANQNFVGTVYLYINVQCTVHHEVQKLRGRKQTKNNNNNGQLWAVQTIDTTFLHLLWLWSILCTKAIILNFKYIYIYITRLYWKSYTVYIHYTPKQSVLFEKEKWHTSI